jgi:competence protein ComEC
MGAGLCIGSILGLGVPLSPWVIGALVLTTGVLLQRWSRVPRGYVWLLLGLLLAHGRVAWQDRAFPPSHVTHLVAANTPRPLTVEGTLVRVGEARDQRQRLYVALTRWREDQHWHPATGLVRLTVPADAPSLLPGDGLRVAALRLHQASARRNPSGFDLQRFLRWQGIYAIGGIRQGERLQLLQRPSGFLLARTLEQWRRQLHERVQGYLTPPYDRVFLAMVLGHQGDLPAAVEESFRVAGATHLLVVSGLNVGLIAASALLFWRGLLRQLRGRIPPTWLPAWRPTPLAACLSLPVVLLYCSLVGWEVPTTRAALMTGSYLLALTVQRQRDPLQALLLAATFILLLEPTALFTVGCQLSFAAVVGILLTARRLLPLPPSATRRRRWGRQLSLYILTGSAAYLATLPILASAFRTLPTFGIPANLLLVPLAGILTPLGMLALGMVTLWPSLGGWLFPLLQLLLSWMLAIADYTAALPGAQVHLAAPAWFPLVAYYGLLGSIWWWPAQHWRWLGVWSTLLLLGVGWQYLATRPQELQVTFLDVGTGDAIVVQIPGSHALLIDGGGTYDGRFDIGTQVLAPFLWDHYVRRIAFMALTHPQANHARGLGSVLQRFPTDHLLSNGTPLTRGYLRDLVTGGARWGTQQHTALDGPREWQWERLRLTVLSPPSTQEQQHTVWTPPTENDRSLVLRLQYGHVRLLLTGDIQHATERWLLAQRPDLRADILHVPHHGSRTSTHPAFLAQVRPAVGIISTGVGNAYGHPHARVLATLAAQGVEVFRTDAHGAIRISSDGSRYQVRPFRPYRPAVLGVSAPPSARVSETAE